MIKVRIKKLPTARTGYQVQGALVNDVPAMGGADYNAYIGRPKLKESKYITGVPREEANLEAEGGETVYGDINGDGFPEHQIIKGPRHHSGGVPLNLPDDTFIFSDTRTMKIKDPEILEMFGKAGTSKAYTPAQLAKQYDVQKYRKILEDPESDTLDRKTAELMIKKYVIKLGCLALAQEAKKGFPQGIPAVAKPCMDAKGITAEQVLPPKEIMTVKDQIDAQYNQEENSEETMESENTDQFAQAQELNQGQPVAQPQEEQMQQPMSPEGMMQYGGQRRLRRAQEGMEQPAPEQEGGGNGLAEITQQVMSALQEGADPQQVVMTLLENQLPPENIVEIFMQLGASQEEAVSLIQEVVQQAQGGGQEQAMEQQPMSEEQMMQQQMMQQQAPPMAQYGMTMGGYDLPFYDEYEEEIPEAEYGMAMGSGMSQNYQGRPKPLPGSGPMFPLPKASDGKIIKRSDYASDAEYEKALYNANLERKQSGKDYEIQAIGSDGTPQLLSGFKRSAPTDVGALDMSKWGNTDLAKGAAAQYYLLQQSVSDPNSEVRKTLCDETNNVLGNEAHFRSKSKPDTPTKNWSQRGLTAPDCDQVINAFLKHQERNLMFQAKAIDGQLYADSGRGFAKWEDSYIGGRLVKGVGTLINEGSVVKNPRDPSGNTLVKTKTDMIDAQNYLKSTYGGTNVSNIAATMGVPFEVGTTDRALQQATFHGYVKMLENSQNGVYNADKKYALRNFLGDLQSGVGDEMGMTAAFPTLKGTQFMISPIDDFTTIDKSYYGNTTMEHLAGAGLDQPQYTTIPPVSPDCQCEDPNLPTYSQYKDESGNCTCTPPADVEEKICPCYINGVETTLTPNADGSCPPCEQEEDVEIEGPPAEWWLQDTIKTTGAFGDLMGIKKYMPWAPSAELQKPRPTFLDPTRELAANAEQANIQTQAVAQFAGPQALSSRSASIQGQAAKTAADVLSKYNNANVTIANEFELKGVDIANQEALLKQATASKLYDQNTIANQQFDNSKLAMRNNLRNYYTNAITNRWQTDALNQMFPNYQVSPGVGGQMYFNPTEKTPNPLAAGTAKFDWQAAKDECTKANPSADATLIKSCIESKRQASAATATTSGADANMANVMYQGKKKGGPVNKNKGYIYLDSWLPFLM